MTPTRISVAGTAPYDVVIGPSLLDELAALVPAGATRALLVHAGPLAAVADDIEAALAAAGLQVVRAPVPDGEQAKDVTVAASLWALLGRSGFTRTDLVVGLGGGAVTDLAGFVAATWLRGVAVLQVPTTLLGMVDAAVGGKTGINTAEGKNLVGSFHPPVAVVCDLDLLATLPRADYVSGLAEVVKAGFIADPVILDLVEEDVAAAATPTGPHTRELVERAVRVKAEVVAEDLRERGRREILNYGHTLGHAIEQVERYRWRHGDAVAVGMVFAAELSCLAGRLAGPQVQRHRAVLRELGLPVTYPSGRWPQLLSVMQVDKKTRGAQLRFVVLDDVGRPGLLAAPDEAMLGAAYDAVSDDRSAR